MITAAATCDRRQFGDSDYHFHTALHEHWRLYCWKLLARADIPPWSDEFDPDCYSAARVLFDHFCHFTESDFRDACDILRLAEVLRFPPLHTISYELALSVLRLFDNNWCFFTEDEELVCQRVAKATAQILEEGVVPSGRFSAYAVELL